VSPTSPRGPTGCRSLVWTATAERSAVRIFPLSDGLTGQPPHELDGRCPGLGMWSLPDPRFVAFGLNFWPPFPTVHEDPPSKSRFLLRQSSMSTAFFSGWHATLFAIPPARPRGPILVSNCLPLWRTWTHFGAFFETPFLWHGMGRRGATMPKSESCISDPCFRFDHTVLQCARGSRPARWRSRQDYESGM